jgi:CheY-like chemotaxis protein
VYITAHGVEALDFLRTTADWVSPSLPSSSSAQVEQEGATETAGNAEAGPAGTAEGEAEPTEPVRLSVIFMDVSMPIMDGFACTSQIREYQSTGHLARHIPIMGMCPYLMPEMEARLRHVGMDDAIDKPIRRLELLSKLGTLLGQQFPLPSATTPASTTDMPAAPV